MICLIIAVCLAQLALTLPDHPDALGLSFLQRMPLELPAALLVLLLLPRRLAAGFAVLCTLLVFVMLFLKLADIGTQSAFQRPFNPYLDVKMMLDGWNLFSGTFGTAVAFAGVAALAAAFIGLALAFRWSLRRLALAEGAARRGLQGGLGVLLGVAVLVVALSPRPLSWIDARAGGYLAERLDLVVRSIVDMRTFEAELTAAETLPPPSDLFRAVAGRDVVLIFVESYGRSALEDPRYAPVTGPRLAEVQQQIQAAGLQVASSWLRSPTVGGLSWLAHGTFLSGLWVDSQARYDLLMMSERPSLNRLFSDAGWHSLAVMPAITMAWPESAYYGYDRVLAAADLGYRGKPYNWVTMPDQYTLSAFERLGRAPQQGQGKAVMAEIALISSHAPWTPVASLVDWEAVGDGTVFNDQATSGDPPAVVWSDPDRVRRQYIATIDYSLQTLGAYMSRFGRDTVFIVLGDHQPAAIVTGANASRDVPVHIVSSDPALMQRFRAAGFSQGMIPDAQGGSRLMSDMRALLLDVLGAPLSGDGAVP